MVINLIFCILTVSCRIIYLGSGPNYHKWFHNRNVALGYFYAISRAGVDASFEFIFMLQLFEFIAMINLILAQRDKSIQVLLYNYSAENRISHNENLPQQVRKSMFKQKENRMANIFLVLFIIDFVGFLVILVVSVFFRNSVSLTF